MKEKGFIDEGMIKALMWVYGIIAVIVTIGVWGL